jgi:hypothetical protein
MFLSQNYFYCSAYSVKYIQFGMCILILRVGHSVAKEIETGYLFHYFIIFLYFTSSVILRSKYFLYIFKLNSCIALGSGYL